MERWASLLLAMAACCACRAESSPIDQAFASMYNANSSGAHRLLNDYIAKQPDDPLPYSVRAAAYLFGELDRLMILESEFFSDDRRISEKKKLKADPGVR